jgi:hypothetical protein
MMPLRELAGVLGPERLRTVAWGALWFLVVVAFTAGVGIIQTAGAAGQMPPLTSTVHAPADNGADDPSSAPVPGALRAG